MSSYARLSNYNGHVSNNQHFPMNTQTIPVNNHSHGYNSLTYNNNGNQYNNISQGYGSTCENFIQQPCGNRNLQGANEYYNNDVTYQPARVRGSWDQVKGLYELNPQADNCIVKSKKSSKKEYFSNDNELIIISADSWCGYSKKIKQILGDIKKLLGDIGVKVTYVSDKDNKSDFDALSKENNVRGYPTMLFNSGGNTQVWPGFMPAKSIQDKVKQHLGGGGDTARTKIQKGDDITLTCVSANSWCGYSKKLSESKDEFVKVLGNNGINFDLINDTDNKNKFDKMCKENNVRGYPHCMLLVNGKKVSDISGYRPAQKMLEECKKALKN